MLFGSSGIRRRFDQTLADIALRVGSVLASGSPDVILGMDTRTTSPLLKDLVIAGILGGGGTVKKAGIVPTPTVAFNSRSARAGCMITASHNPEEYNGLKLFNPDGSSFTLTQQADMEALLGTQNWTDWMHQGRVEEFDAVTPHKSAILNQVNIPGNRSAVLDCGNGAGSLFTPSLLSDAGVRTTCINCNPSGFFARPSEPLQEHVSFIGSMVKKTGAGCGVIHDGDADRMMGFDNRGRYISGDHLLVLFARYLDAKRVVTTSDASMVIEECAEVRRTPVGDAFVSEELLNWGDFGGEPSGAWIFPKVSLCPDGPFAAALFCEMSSEWDIAREIDTIPAYHLLRQSFACENAGDILIRLGATIPTDGIRISDEEGWCLIRASGTEPKIRITAEGKTLPKVKALMAMGKERVKQGKTA
jgi:phosphoglucosamine mutase